jgi:hypothetical protein
MIEHFIQDFAAKQKRKRNDDSESSSSDSEAPKIKRRRSKTKGSAFKSKKELAEWFKKKERGSLTLAELQKCIQVTRHITFGIIVIKKYSS